MGGVRFIAVLTFLSGIAALLGWLFLTGADATAMRLLRRSLWYFVVVPILLGIPLIAIAAIGGLTDFPMSPYVAMAFYVAIEEALKLWAARSQTSGIRIFALVSLFGIIELMLAKPFLIDLPTGEVEHLLALAAMVPALFMHILTAAIYAFHWRDRPHVQLMACLAVHYGFNFLAMQDLLFADAWWLATLIPLIGATWLLIPPRGSEKRGSWELPAEDKPLPAPGE